MDYINKLTEYRTKHGFYLKDYTRYFDFIKSKRKDPEYKSEYFLTRYYIYKSKRRLANKYIKKAHKYSNFNEIFCAYISGIFYSQSNIEKAVYNYNIARTLSATNFIFVKEIYEHIEILTSILPTYIYQEWNGLNLKFVNEEDLLSFNEIKKMKGNDYQSCLKNFIVKLKKLQNELNIYSDKNAKRFKNIYEKVKKLYECLNEFVLFLENNFVDNVYVVDLNRETYGLLVFYENILKYKNCDLSVSNMIDEFKISNNYEYLQNAIEYAKNNKKISLKKAREIVIKEIEKSFEYEENSIKMPFLPIYYDLAYDYVQYPDADEGKVNKLFRGLSFFNK